MTNNTAPAVPDTQMLRVLLVEDSPTEAMLIQASMEDTEDVRFEVVHVATLADTFSAMALAHFDVVILDLTLPDSIGIETFVRLHERHPSTPIVVLTANSSRSLAVQTVQSGAQDYILKEQIENMQLPLSLRYAIERKKGEEALKKANADIEAAYSQLKSTQAQLIQNEKLASIGQLAAGVAHEMNTPLGFVISNLDTLKNYMGKLQAFMAKIDSWFKDASPRLDDALKAQAAQILQTQKDLRIDFVLKDAPALLAESREGLDTVAQIVQSLRDFTRIDQAEAWGEYDLHRGIESTLMMAKGELAGIEIRLELADVPPVQCHATQINEALLNILRNAAEAVRGMGPDHPAWISVRTGLDAQCVRCEIADNGPGIAPDVLPKIFDPFFTTKPVGAGKGLGLTIAHDIIVKKHGGRIHAHSEPGQGAMFQMVLPIARQGG